ncbi:hypothetical protein, partial [Aquisphaera insulae]|uniref:hypothetical protein n=1 Tax=Aquisphaera insulae TaxID=2712864 RepID=UPI00196B427E
MNHIRRWFVNRIFRPSRANRALRIGQVRHRRIAPRRRLRGRRFADRIPPLAEPAELVKDLHQLPAHRRDLAPRPFELGLREERRVVVATGRIRITVQRLDPPELVVDDPQ